MWTFFCERFLDCLCCCSMLQYGAWLLSRVAAAAAAVAACESPWSESQNFHLRQLLFLANLKLPFLGYIFLSSGGSWGIAPEPTLIREFESLLLLLLSGMVPCMIHPRADATNCPLKRKWQDRIFLNLWSFCDLSYFSGCRFVLLGFHRQ